MSTPLLLVFKKQPNYLIAWVNHDGDSLCSTFKETKIEELDRLFEQLWEYRNNSKVYVSSIITNDSKTEDYGLKYDVCLANTTRFTWEENTDFIGSFRYGDDLTKVSADKLLDVYYNITERNFFNDFYYYCIIDLDKERVGSSGDYKRVPKMVRCGRKSNFDGKGFGARDNKNNIDYYDMRKSSLNTDYEDADSFDESKQFNKNILKENDDKYDGKYYVDIEDEDEDAIYSSDIEFNSPRKAVSWAYDELENNKDNDDVYQASIYQMFINEDGDLDHELIEVIHKDDLDESKQISRKRNLIHESYSDLIRSKIFDVGHKFGLDVYGTDDGGIVFENENMPTSDDEELLVSLEKFENSIIIKYNDEDNVVVYLKDNLDDIDESYEMGKFSKDEQIMIDAVEKELKARRRNKEISKSDYEMILINGDYIQKCFDCANGDVDYTGDVLTDAIYIVDQIISEL